MTKMTIVENVTEFENFGETVEEIRDFFQNLCNKYPGATLQHIGYENPTYVIHHSREETDEEYNSRLETENKAKAVAAYKKELKAIEKKLKEKHGL